MEIVTLTSGGLDSTLMALLIAEENQTQHPLFIDYGQKAKNRELSTCRKSFRRWNLPEPRIASLPGFGKLIRSGLTDPGRDTVEDAFTPGRNAMFLLIAASYGATLGVRAVAIGLLDEQYRLFPDQSRSFLDAAEEFLFRALGHQVAILAPLMKMSKTDVVALARTKGLLGTTYSCHEGGPEPCGKCIACREFEGTGV